MRPWCTSALVETNQNILNLNPQHLHSAWTAWLGLRSSDSCHIVVIYIYPTLKFITWKCRLRFHYQYSWILFRHIKEILAAVQDGRKHWWQLPFLNFPHLYLHLLLGYTTPHDYVITCLYIESTRCIVFIHFHTRRLFITCFTSVLCHIPPNLQQIYHTQTGEYSAHLTCTVTSLYKHCFECVSHLSVFAHQYESRKYYGVPFDSI